MAAGALPLVPYVPAVDCPPQQLQVQCKTKGKALDLMSEDLRLLEHRGEENAQTRLTAYRKPAGVEDHIKSAFCTPRIKHTFNSCSTETCPLQGSIFLLTGVQL